MVQVLYNEPTILLSYWHIILITPASCNFDVPGCDVTSGRSRAGRTAEHEHLHNTRHVTCRNVRVLQYVSGSETGEDCTRHEKRVNNCKTYNHYETSYSCYMCNIFKRVNHVDVLACKAVTQNLIHICYIVALYTSAYSMNE